MRETDLTNLVINKLTREQYNTLVQNNQVNENELYLVPDNGTSSGTGGTVNITIDETLNVSSNNPVTNSAVTDAVNNLTDLIDQVANDIPVLPGVEYVGQSTINSGGAAFSFGSNFKDAIYIFAMGNCFTILPCYNLTNNTDYVVNGSYVNTSGAITNERVVFNFNETDGYLRIRSYSTTNLMATNYIGYLFKLAFEDYTTGGKPTRPSIQRPTSDDVLINILSSQFTSATTGTVTQEQWDALWANPTNALVRVPMGDATHYFRVCAYGNDSVDNVNFVYLYNCTQFSVTTVIVTSNLTFLVNDTNIEQYPADTALSSTSENPVQNKVIKAYVDGLVGDIETLLQNI